MKRFGPKGKDSPSLGEKCVACKKPFLVGDYTTLIGLGPGDDFEEQQRAFAGRPYTAVAVEVHFACAGGKDGDENG